MIDTIKIYVQDESGERQEVEAPTDMGLSVMEILKASEYEIAAVCGGMALCATCHVEVIESAELPEIGDAEADMLDTLPHATSNSRLSCQLRLSPALDGLVVRLKPEM